MTITLTIVNVEVLPGGAPAFFRTVNRGFHVGREKGLDWTLQDPSRQISSRHCEVRYENGAYWLYDRSTNGVFLNGSSQRVRGPHRLANGDRMTVGPYVIDVAIAGGAGVRLQTPPVAGARPAGPASDPPGAAARAGSAARTETLNAAPRRPPPGSFLEAFCAGAGIPADVLASRDQAELARELGEFVRLTVDNLGQMLRARAAAKTMTRSSSRTVIGATDNNPLKHVPASADVIEAMFSRKRAGYLDARRSLENAFGDLQKHEHATYAAMQKALGKLLDQFAPETIEMKVSSSAFASKKGRAWDLFVERWEERNAGENGMLDTFLAYFAEAYDDETSSKE